MLVMSYNPGYQNVLKGLKPSTRQRFVALDMSYPSPDVECQIVEIEGGVDNTVASSLVRLAQALRSLTDHDLEETASTRLLVAAARLHGAGLPMLQACRAAIVNALTDDPATASGLHEVVRAVMGDGR